MRALFYVREAHQDLPSSSVSGKNASDTCVKLKLKLSDDNKQRGALKSLELVGSTAQLREDNRICIWLEDVWSER